MARTRFPSAAAAAAICLALAPSALSAADGLKVQFGPDGLKTVQYAGQEFLAEGTPAGAIVVLETRSIDDSGTGKYAFEQTDGSTAKTVFLEAEGTLRQQYPWGAVDYRYYSTDRDKDGRVTCAIQIKNTGTKTVADFRLQPFSLKLPGLDAKAKIGVENTLDRPIAIAAQTEKWLMLATYDSVAPAVRFGFAPPVGGDKARPLVIQGGVGLLDLDEKTIHPHGMPRIAPGGTLELQFSLWFAPADANRDELLGDLYARFAEAFPFANAWPDHRPIGALNLPTGGPGKSKTNPRGWFGKKELDVSTAEGKAELKKLFMDYADRSVKAMTDTGSQGMIVWNLEGEENPHPISYIGDPRMLNLLDPEVEPIADEFFKKFRDAGLRTGVCIRPTQVYYKETKNEAGEVTKRELAHGTGSDMPGRNEQFQSIRPKNVPAWRFFPVVDRINDKITYAKKRWGCTIFYIDTNGIFLPLGEKNDFQWRLLTTQMWQAIKRAHPDVLLIPELHSGDGTHHLAQWSVCAEYLELDYGGQWVTPSLVRKLYPRAFSVINMKDAKNYTARKEDLIRGVMRGDILLHRGWFGCSVNKLVKEVYTEAARRKAQK